MDRLFDAEKVKLVIWDLDDTVWNGTLAEGDSVLVRDDVATFIREITEHGIVSSISSKNDFESARSKLCEFGLWDHFVFPAISFAAKGALVRETLEAMQLRPVNAVFVDDSAHNRHDVAAACPGIMTIDASNPAELAQFLEATLDAHRSVHKSRLADYRLLEARHAGRQNHKGTNKEFLRSSHIHICFVPRQDNLPYVARIEELINRSNQMNYTKSRVAEGEIRDRIILNRGESESVFAWDDFGYYGLIGFYTVDVKKHVIVHLVFSCRVMNMGIEHAVARRIERRHKMECSLVPVKAHWLTVKTYFDDDAREFIFAHESRAKLPPVARVMANCQSAAIADFTGMADRLDYDNYPRVFKLARLLEGQSLDDSPALLVYGGFVDYARKHWPSGFEPTAITEAVLAFRSFVESTGRRALVLVPDDSQFVGHPDAEILRSISAAWRRVEGSPSLDVRIIPAHDGKDFRHFSRQKLHEIGQEVRIWLDEQLASPAFSAAAARYALPPEPQYHSLVGSQLASGT